MWDKSQPLWLPKGSVRAIIAIYVVVLVTAFFVALGGEIAVAALAGTLATVVTFYFNQKDKEEAVRQALYTPVPDEKPEE